MSTLKIDVTEKVVAEEKAKKPYQDVEVYYSDLDPGCMVEGDNDVDSVSISIKGYDGYKISVYKDDIDGLIRALEKIKNYT